MISLDSTNEQIIAEMERLRTLYALKTTLRYKSTRNTAEFSESVAEHLFGMEILSHYFLPLEDPEGRLDRMRIHDLILFHELGEIETGDIIMHEKTDVHRCVEREAAERTSKRLPESLSQIALERSREFEEHVTSEAVFANAIDKIEPIFELFDDMGLALYKAHNMNQAAAMTGKRKATEAFPYMRRFLEAWEARALALDVFPN